MRFHISQADSENGTNINIETIDLHKATEVTMALIRGGFFEKDRSVDIFGWQDNGKGYEQVSSVILFNSKALRAGEEGV